MKKFYLFSILIANLVFSQQTVTQLGSDLEGSTQGVLFGYSVALNSAGNILAVSSPGADVPVANAGRVDIFQYASNSNQWVTSAAFTKGRANEYFGTSLDINGDGTSVVVGGEEYNNGAGSVSVFQNSGGSWGQKGSTLTADAGDRFGVSVSINKYGDIIAIGSSYDDDGGIVNRGSCSIYQYQIDNWVRIGYIWGDSANENFGESVSLDSTGRRVAVGSIGGNGSVKVFDFNSSTTQWDQIGGDTNGGQQSANFGHKVELNDAGTTFVVGDNEREFANSNEGELLVYSLVNNTWTQIKAFMGASGDELGAGVAMNRTGSIIATGAIGHDNRRGTVRVYNANANWAQAYADIDGSANNDEVGFALSMNSSGDVIAMGAPIHDSQKGSVKVYSLQSDNTPPSVPIGLTASKYYGGATLKWNANSESDLSVYKIAYGTDPSSLNSSTITNTNSVTVTGLTIGQKYYFSILARDNSGNESALSSSISTVASGSKWVDMHHALAQDVVATHGFEENLPFKSVHFALSNMFAESGSNRDTLRIKPSINLTTSGTTISDNGAYNFKGNSITINDSQKNVVIIGTAGSDSTFFDADLTSRHFNIRQNQNSNLTIQGINFINGSVGEDDFGGSINIDSNGDGTSRIKFIDCVFVNNKTIGQMGGAIFINWGSYTYGMEPVEFHNSKFIDNYTASVDDPGFGGAIYSSRSVRIINSVFYNNFATSGVSEAGGGAIYLAPYYRDNSGDWKAPNPSEIVNSTFVNNHTNSKEGYSSTGGTLYGYGWIDEGINNTIILNSIIAGSRTLTAGLENNNGFRLDIDFNDAHKFLAVSSMLENSTNESFSYSANYNFSANPRFVNESGFEFQDGIFLLSDDSPLIGRGSSGLTDIVTIISPTVDINGNSRGTPPDIGAFENSLNEPNRVISPKLYISTTGSNSNSGTIDNPVLDLETALDLVQSPLDTIVFLKGTHKGLSNTEIYFDDAGNSNYSGLTIMGDPDYPPDSTIIDAEFNTFHMVFYGESNNMRIHNITLANGYGAEEYQGGSVTLENFANPTFTKVLFLNNQSESNNNAYSDGGAVRVSGAKGSFINCVFRENKVYAMNSNQYSEARGGAISIAHGHEQDHVTIINRCRFIDNEIHSMNRAVGSAISVLMGQADITNNLIRNNRAISYDPGDSYTQGSIYYEGPYYFDQEQGIVKGDVERRYIANNNIIYNSAESASSDNFAQSGIFIQHMDEATKLTNINNIVFENASSMSSSASQQYIPEQVLLQSFSDLSISDHNLVESPLHYLEGANSDTLFPRFVNASDGNFRLSPSSPAIGAGCCVGDENSYVNEGNGYLLKNDFFGAERPSPVGSISDIGAIESPLESNFALSLEANFSSQSQIVDAGLEYEVLLSLKVNGEQISDGTKIDWDVFPDEGFVSIVSSDSLTSDGSVKVTIQISESVPQGFKFQVRAKLYDSYTVSSESYSVGEIEYIPLPSPIALFEFDGGWSNNNDFTVSWEAPDWPYPMEGIWIELENEEPEFFAFEEGSESVTEWSFNLPRNGIFDGKMWFQDIFHQNDPDNYIDFTVGYDNVQPYEFDLYEPGYWTTGQSTEFVWQYASDNASGIHGYEIIIDNESFFMEIDDEDYEAGNDIIYIHEPTLPQREIYWTVNAVDNAGNMKGSEIRTLNIDRSPPSISHIPLSTTDLGQSTPIITASVADNNALQSVELFYKIGDGSWIGPIDILGSGFSISGAEVTEAGLAYQINAYDEAGNISIYGPVDVGVIISGDGLESSPLISGTEVSAYQLISFPILPNDKSTASLFEDDLGPYDDTKWRLFGFKNGTYEEYPSTIETGKSYLLITNESGLIVDSDEGRTASIVQDYQVSLNQGDWTLIGNPFDFPVPLSMILTSEGNYLSDDPNVYEFKNGQWRSASVLEPWGGIAYKSNSANRVFIQPNINGEDNNSFSRKVPTFSNVLKDGEWYIDIVADNGFGVDEFNRVGIKHGSKDGYDHRDGYEPPMLPGGVSLRIPHDDWDEHSDIYTTDFREFSDEGQFWDFEVVSGNIDFNTFLKFDGLENIPENFEVFLIDKSIKTSQNLKWKSDYLFDVASLNSVRKLRLVVGEREFLNANNGGIDLFPNEFNISQNYPNPFNSQTSLNISLMDNAIIDIDIYNLLGEKVVSLATQEHRPAGYYTFIWDGKDQFGNILSSGVYLAAGRIADIKGNSLKIQNRKMVLVK